MIWAYLRQSLRQMINSEDSRNFLTSVSLL